MFTMHIFISLRIKNTVFNIFCVYTRKKGIIAMLGFVPVIHDAAII